VRHHVAVRKARLGLAGGKPPQQVRPATRVQSGRAKAGAWFVGAVVAQRHAPHLTHRAARRGAIVPPDRADGAAKVAGHVGEDALFLRNVTTGCTTRGT